jgi:cell division protein FtsA
MTVVQFEGRNPPRRGEGTGRAKIVAALDIGTTKITCVIAEAVPQKHKLPGGSNQPLLKVLGIGHQASRGLKGGAIVDVEQAERAVRIAVDSAERMAETTIGDVFVAITGGRPATRTYTASVATRNGEVGFGDIDAVLGEAATQVEPKRRTILHLTPVQFHLDGVKGIKAPAGMYGETLSADLRAVTVDQAAIKNLALVVERCHLSLAGTAIAPYAAAKSVLAEDEMGLGVTLLELGGATTGIAVFQDGHLVFADVVPIGGQHVTNDIARGLSTTVAHAERMKTLWGTALASSLDEREMIAVPALGERGVDTVHKVPKSMLTGIIRPRLEEIFEKVKERLKEAGVEQPKPRRLVLTGGGSQLTGIRDMAAAVLDAQTRIGSPLNIAGLPEVARTPCFGVAAGLLVYALKPDQHHAVPRSLQGNTINGGSYMRRVGRWIAESF